MAKQYATLVFRNDEPGKPAFEGVLIDVAADMNPDEIIAARLCPARVILQPDGAFMQLPIDFDDHEVFAGMIEVADDGTFVPVAQQSDVAEPKPDEAFLKEYRAGFAARRAAKWERLHKRRFEDERAQAERERGRS
jgi:hypothetical protein